LANTAYALQAASLALLIVANSGVTAQELGLPSAIDEKARWALALTGGVWGNKWQENLSGTSRHVYERATLPVVAIELNRNTTSDNAKFRLNSSYGKSIYDGWTSNGQAIMSTSDLDMRGAQVEYQWKLSPDLAWGFRAEHELFSRQINGVAGIKGYLEEYTRSSLLVGGTKAIQFSGGNSLSLAFWFGGGEGHKMKLKLDPYEEATVKLGSTRKMDVSATWQAPLDRSDQSKWDFIGQLAFKRSETGQSDVGDLNYRGRSIGTFIQPSTETSGWQVTMGIARIW
jgi:hypothetical protein